MPGCGVFVGTHASEEARKRVATTRMRNRMRSGFTVAGMPGSGVFVGMHASEERKVTNSASAMQRPDSHI
uniref:Uncharacterized protein n=1 Tax=Pristionchus pacificus TaxID=54126 RepID=A0A2A6CKC5_PRIPA|eukprot:PDM78675.1 hypothetical protein PRIPAC_31254 [Pristionchus pacificus]